MISIFLRWHIIDLGAHVQFQLASFFKTWLLEVPPVTSCAGTSHGFPAPHGCAQSLETLLAVPINHCCPPSLSVSIMGFCSLSIWLMSHSTEQTSEPGDPEAPHSAIPPTALLLNVSRREMPCAAALSCATIPTHRQG